MVLDRVLRMVIDPPERHISLTRENQESFLAHEAAPLSGNLQCTQVAPRVVELSGVSASFFGEHPLFFSRQLLPNAFTVEGDSIKTIANGIISAIIGHVSDDVPAWNLHIIDPATVETGEIYSRPRLVRDEVLSLLKRKRRALLKSLLPPDAASRNAPLVQALLVSPHLTYMSVTSPEEIKLLRAVISPHPAGFVPIPDDKAPPSRAFKKLREAIEVFELSPRRGETCVDLGASPGGWTYVMVDRGLSVTAIDRSPLDEALMRNKRVNFVQGDALSWLPATPVEWLICDVITTPDRTCEMLDAWLSKDMCSNFCVTVKFKGTPDFDTLLELRRLLAEKAVWYDGKQLTNNKNELTIVGKSRRTKGS